MYSSYTAASFARKPEIADRHGVNLQGALTWAFEFEGQPYFAGFRVLSSHGVDHPVLNVFRMFGRMGGRRLSVDSSHAVALDVMLKEGVRGQPDVAAVASLEKNTLSVLLWHYHDDDLPGPDAAVALALQGLPRKDVAVTHFRIDAERSNAFEAWQAMGSPQAPTPVQQARLQEAGQLALLEPPRTLRPQADGTLPLLFSLPRQAVSLVQVRWA